MMALACGPGADAVFVQAPEPPPNASSALFIFEVQGESSFAVALDSTDAAAMRFEIDTFETAQIHGLFYACSLEDLAIPKGRHALSVGGRALPKTTEVRASSYSSGAQTAWISAELPTEVRRLTLALEPLAQSSVVVPCLLPEEAAWIKLPTELLKPDEDVRWISVLGGDEILGLTEFGSLIRGTPDRLEVIATTGLSLVSHGTTSDDETWWAVGTYGNVYRGDFSGRFVDLGRTRSASAAAASGREDQIVVAPDGSEVYVYTEERTLERCVPAAEDAPCDWQIVGSTEPGMDEHLRMIYLASGHVLAVGTGSPVLEYDNGILKTDHVFRTDTGHAVGRGGPEFGTVIVGIAGAIAFRANGPGSAWNIDDPRLTQGTGTYRTRFVAPTRRGFIFGGVNGIVLEYDSDLGFCPIARIGVSGHDVSRAHQSETGYWFLQRRGIEKLYFARAKEPSCLDTFAP